jgi:hypothetical protein
MSLHEELREVLADSRQEMAQVFRQMLEQLATVSPTVATAVNSAPSRDAAPVLIRPPDPLVAHPTLAIGPYTSAEATRRLLDLAFRDCHSCLDLTFGHGGCWRRPYPPGLRVVTNNLDPSSAADLHLDFTATGLPDRAYDVVLIDPPHLADGGADSIMGRRFGSVPGTPRLRRQIEAGVAEAWRLAAVGVLVKLVDHSHGGRYLQLSRWAADVLNVEPYCVVHTCRRPLTDGKWKVQRAPRSNGATWMAFRRDGGDHHDFVRQYERQVASRLAEQKAARRCVICDAPIGDRRRDAATCSDLCRKQRQRKTAGPR